MLSFCCRPCGWMFLCGYSMLLYVTRPQSSSVDRPWDFFSLAVYKTPHNLIYTNLKEKHSWRRRPMLFLLLPQWQNSSLLLRFNGKARTLSSGGCNLAAGPSQTFLRLQSAVIQIYSNQIKRSNIHNAVKHEWLKALRNNCNVRTYAWANPLVNTILWILE